MYVDMNIRASNLKRPLDDFLEMASRKVKKLNKTWNPEKGSPVFTCKGQYISRGWTEWTQGFQFGCQALLFDAIEDDFFHTLALNNTLCFMAPHVSHIGVHDHGFNNISTYGNLRRFIRERKCPDNKDLLAFHEMALKISGAVQASRWTSLPSSAGYIYSFNGPHSLFCDTIRSCRSLILAHQLGHHLMGENDCRISLLKRALIHTLTTIRYNVYRGENRDSYDIRGRVAHESLFNINDGCYRCPSTQQGYSPFSTWTRGLSWIILGLAEQLEYLNGIPDEEFSQTGLGSKYDILRLMTDAAEGTAEYYIKIAAKDGVPYWDTGAPGLAQMPDYVEMKSRPDNPYEPVDSSAAAITAQGMLRLGRLLGNTKGKRYLQAGLTISQTLLSSPYFSENPRHQGLILHSVYHRPNGWDYIPRGKTIPQGESSMWGDYHAMELAVYLQRMIRQEQGMSTPYLTFFDQNSV